MQTKVGEITSRWFRVSQPLSKLQSRSKSKAVTVVVVSFTGKCLKCRAAMVVYWQQTKMFVRRTQCFFVRLELSFSQEQPCRSYCRSRSLAHTHTHQHTCSLCTPAHTDRERGEGVLLAHPDISRLSRSSPLCHPTENKEPLKSLQHQWQTKNPTRCRAGTSDTHHRAQTHNPNPHTRAHTGSEWVRYKSPVSFLLHHKCVPALSKHSRAGTNTRDKQSGSSVSLEAARRHLYRKIK